MSTTIDVNVLVHASNRADLVHEAALSLVERLARGPELVYLFWPVLMGYLRVVTHPGVLPRPLSPADAAANVGALLLPPMSARQASPTGSGTSFAPSAATASAATRSPTVTSSR